MAEKRSKWLHRNVKFLLNKTEFDSNNI